MLTFKLIKRSVMRKFLLFHISFLCSLVAFGQGQNQVGVVVESRDQAQHQAGNGKQLYNMNFDEWSKKGKEWRAVSKIYKDTVLVWDTANHGLSLLGINGVEPEYEHLAVQGAGKCAARLHSEKVLWAFAAGALYTGSFVRIVNWSGAEITWGVPFDERPKYLQGFYHYIPAKITHSRKPFKHLKGTQDIGQIAVLLTDWEEPFHIITNKGQFVDIEKDPHIIGAGDFLLTEETDGYIPFQIPIIYRNDRTPKFVVIITTSSRHGDFFTGGNGSVLYIDEFKFIYENENSICNQ